MIGSSTGIVRSMTIILVSARALCQDSCFTTEGGKAPRRGNRGDIVTLLTRSTDRKLGAVRRDPWRGTSLAGKRTVSYVRSRATVCAVHSSTELCVQLDSTPVSSQRQARSDEPTLDAGRGVSRLRGPVSSSREAADCLVRRSGSADIGCFGLSRRRHRSRRFRRYFRPPVDATPRPVSSSASQAFTSSTCSWAERCPVS